MIKQRFHWPRTILPQIVAAGRYPMEASRYRRVYQLSEHALHLYEYCGQMCFNKQEVQLHHDTMTLTPAGVPTVYDLSAPGTHLCIHFKVSHSRRNVISLPLHQRLAGRRPQVAQRLMHIIAMHNRSQVGHPSASLAAEAASAALLELLLYCAVINQSPSGPKVTEAALAIDRVAMYINEHYDKPMRIDQLVKVAELSQGYLSKLFKQRYGCTIQQYLIRRRINVAIHLLQSTRLPIKQIAIMTGFQQLPYFHRQFRMITGETPALWRTHGRPRREDPAKP